MTNAHPGADVRVAVAVLCHNEATTIAKVVRDFRSELPEADVVVADNASADATSEEARKAGARVVREKRRGKGYAFPGGRLAGHDLDRSGRARTRLPHH